MIDYGKVTEALQSLEKQALFQKLYPGQSAEKVQERYERIISQFKDIFGQPEKLAIISAPGRSEIGGNHTDHQGGNVVTASVNLDALGVAAYNDTNIIRLQSEGYEICSVALDDMNVQESEYNSTKALIRGVAARFMQMGYEVKGFDAFVSSDVLPGSGLSSSAAFEVWVGVAINTLFCKEAVSAEEIAKIGQYAENVFFGKPSGLQDQMASSVGGAIFIDFENKEKPRIEKLPSDFEGLALCIIDSGADHADLTDEYAAIPQDMLAIAGYFAKEKMRDVSKEAFFKEFAKLREKFGDRAVLRAFHFLQENERALAEAKDLKNNDIESFLGHVKESGQSSYMYLQNIYPAGATKHQDVAIALALCDELLCGRGAFRVHGGGFAGTIQAFVPKEMLDGFVEKMNLCLGEGKCHVLSIRPFGGMVIL